MNRHLFSLKGRIFTVFLILFDVVVIFGLFLHYRSSDPKERVKHLEASLDADYRNLQEQNRRLSAVSFDKALQLAGQLVEDGRIDGFRGYQSDSLKFWSDNKVAFPVILHASDSTMPAVRTCGPGWVLLSAIKFQGRSLLIYDHIYNQYAVENGFLHTGFLKRAGGGDGLKISGDESGFPVELNGRTAFQVRVDQPQSLADVNEWFLLFSVVVNFPGWVYAGFRVMRRRQRRAGLLSGLLAKLAVVVCCWALMGVVVHVISGVHPGGLFGPVVFASGLFNPNLAMLTLNITGILMLSFIIYGKFRKKVNAIGPLQSSVFLVSAALGFRLMVYGFRQMVSHSSVQLDTVSITSFSVYSLLIYGLIFLVFLAWFLPLVPLFSDVWNKGKREKLLMLVVYLSALLLMAIPSYRGLDALLKELMLAGGAFFVFGFTRLPGKSFLSVSFPWLLVIIGLLAALVTGYVSSAIKEKELMKRQAIARNFLMNSRDPLAEQHLKDALVAVKEDRLLAGQVSAFFNDSLSSGQIIDYLRTKYFKGYLRRFTTQITLCFPSDLLNVTGYTEAVSCSSFFKQKMTNASLVDSAGVWFFENAVQPRGYLCYVPVRFSKAVLNIYIEVVPQSVSRGIGIPEIALMELADKNGDFRRYSYARYSNNELISHAGDFAYWRTFPSAVLTKKTDTEQIVGNWSHMVVASGPQSVGVISLPARTLFNQVTLFSYLFIGFGLMLLAGLMIVRMRFQRDFMLGSFRSRLQGTVFVLIFFSLLVIGASSIYFIIRLNEKKNMALLSDKSHSILIELQHNLSAYDHLTKADSSYLEGLLDKLSDVFFTDINLYDAKGFLIASSQPDAYKTGFAAGYMDSEAYQVMVKKAESKLIHLESLGNQQYLSSYLPFVNANNDVLAYLNLPSFSRQEELRSEISSFLVTLINVYAVVLMVASIIGLSVARLLTRPLQMVAKHLAGVKFGLANRKIDWQGTDELGLLIREYNQMIDELDSDAIELKIKEREATWHEMARQIAHEIKNPLTPLRLNVQHLQKAWTDNSPDFGDRLNRFSEVMNEQIDRLTTLASEFGRHGSLPEPKSEPFEVNDFLRRLVALFSAENNEITVRSDADPIIMESDRGLLELIFTNLIKNAVQSVPDGRAPEIAIEVISDLQAQFEFRVSDNGKGISKGEYARIFTPYFTTKTHGSGVGLHLVSQLVSRLNGKIWFESEVNRGTVFFLRFPIGHTPRVTTE